MKLLGKVALVTGASQGIGRAIALALAGEGADIVVNGRNEVLIAETVGAIHQLGRRAIGARADISDAGQVAAMAEQALAAFGRIDILVNNAGGTQGVAPAAHIDELTEADWDRVMDLNLKAPFLCCRALVGYMRAQKRGRIINISSTAGRSNTRMVVGTLPYVAAKAGLLGFTRQLAKELAPYNITVNAVAPGAIAGTAQGERTWRQRSEEAQRASLASIPLGRRGAPEEVAGAVVFLASDDASYITGATIDVNGGSLMI